MKVVWAISIIVVLAVFSYNQNAFAAGGVINGGSSCAQLGFQWIAPFHCIVNGELTINEGENLTVDNVILQIQPSATINNKGTLNINSTLDIRTTFNNSGTVNISGKIISSYGTIENSGTIVNDGTIWNSNGIINNSGTITNGGIITNNGIIENDCDGVITGNLVIDNPPITFCDSDKDDIVDSQDNCPNNYNPNQKDSDNDGIGDECDSTPFPQPPDFDKDGIVDSQDNCPNNYNPNQKDSDNDGIGDECDSTPFSQPPDFDKDGIVDSQDNCPNNYNPNQKDSDGDKIGDECDSTPLPEPGPIPQGVPVPETFDFSISSSTAGTVITAGKEAKAIITVTLESGSSEQVSLSCSGDVSCKVEPNRIMPTDSSILTIYTKDTTKPEQHAITVTAQGGGVKHSTGFTLDVQASTKMKPMSYIKPIAPSEINLPVTFSGEDSNDPDGTIVKYKWDFGDGQTGDGRDVSHIYTSEGTYTVVLTIVDNDGLQSVTERTITMKPLLGLSFESIVFIMLGIIGAVGTIIGLLSRKKKKIEN